MMTMMIGTGVGLLSQPHTGRAVGQGVRRSHARDRLAPDPRGGGRVRAVRKVRIVRDAGCPAGKHHNSTQQDFTACMKPVLRLHIYAHIISYRKTPVIIFSFNKGRIDARYVFPFFFVDISPCCVQIIRYRAVPR